MQSSRQQVEREIGRVQGRIGDLQKQLAQATDDKNNLTIEMEETMNKLNSELAETKHASELQQRQALQALPDDPTAAVEQILLKPSI